MTSRLCAWCDTIRPVKKDGTFRNHIRYPGVRRGRALPYDCPGSGKEPTCNANSGFKVCVLPDGHAGMHESRSKTTWGVPE
jgi:hypothetical protein